MYLEIFCKRLKELREENNLSYRQLSKILQVTDMAVARWERGQRLPNIGVLIKLALYFNVSTDYLLGLEN